VDKHFDYIIVGSGLYGSVFAYKMKNIGKRCLVIEKRNHIAGNLFCPNIEEIRVHKYGPHIFHTDDKEIWDFVNSFVEMNNFIYSPMAKFEDRLYNLPFNMNTFNQLWNITTPEQARLKINSEIEKSLIINPQNLEEQALCLIGQELYTKFIKGYTEKQWGKDAKELPAFIIKRIPLRFTYDNNYFNDRFQGIPVEGYNFFIEKLLEGIEVKLNTDYFHDREYFDSIADKIIFTGRIDEFYNYSFGKLDYRSLSFETEIIEKENFQGVAVINYTEKEIPFTRVIEHKHFVFGQQEYTIVTKEFPENFDFKNEPYYPINNEINNKIFSEYKKMAINQSKYQFGGRLGNYSYYDMDDTIDAALKHVDSEISRPD
jgi:UDP-galactopyranose mutase